MRAVRASEERIGVYSTGEQIAVALVLNKPELFPHGGYTVRRSTVSVPIGRPPLSRRSVS